MIKRILILLTVFTVYGCATAYQDANGAMTGGYSVKHLEGNIYRVAFYGNGYTTYETVQTYWLYRCTELALEKGYDGFEILSNIDLTHSIPAEQFFKQDSPFLKTQVYYIPMDTAPKPELTADILLLKAPLEGVPPKVFDAIKLKESLDPYVLSEEKCSSGNVCEHVHKYIHPEGKFDGI